LTAISAQIDEVSALPRCFTRHAGFCCGIGMNLLTAFECHVEPFFLVSQASPKFIETSAILFAQAALMG